MPIDTALLATLLVYGRTIQEIALRLECTEAEVVSLMQDTPAMLQIMKTEARHLGVWCGENENAVVNHKNLSC